MRGTNNAFGFLRLVLALLVLVDHAFPLGGFGEDPLWRHTRQQESFGGIAVFGFFAVSGYLIAKSASGTDILQFLWRRVIRLFPAYWTMLGVTALVVGPILWSLANRSPSTYWTTDFPGPLTFFTHNWTLSIGQYALHDLLATTTPYGQSIHASALNGSIWTLIYEWHAYLLIGALLAANALRRAPIVVVAITIGLVVLELIASADPAGPGRIAPFLNDPYTVSLTAAFMVAASLAVYSDRVPLDDRLGVMCGVVALATLRYGAFHAIGVPAGVYFVLWLAARLPRPFRRVGHKNDYSYGIYVYGFLVQQVLAYKGAQRWGYFPFLLLSIGAAVAFGMASWHLIEKPALRLKPWGPGRGSAPIVAVLNRARIGRRRAADHSTVDPGSIGRHEAAVDPALEGDSLTAVSQESATTGSVGGER